MLSIFELASIPIASRCTAISRWLAVRWVLWLVMAICGVRESAAQTLNERLVAEPQAALAAEARRDGDPVRGAAVFYARALACSTCHSVGDRPAAIGPDLAKIDPKTTDIAIVEAILEPSKTIAPAYATLTLEMKDGRLLNGLLVEDATDLLILRHAAQPDQLLTLKKSEIESRHASNVSIMPAGQINQLANRQQFLDLVRYLIELREGGPRRARELQPAPDPLTQKVPDEPLPFRPVVQRGEVAMNGNIKYPRGVALGFAGGTVLFDADQLRTVAWWRDGFVKSSPQNYFGLYWHHDGGPAEMLTAGHWLSFQLPGHGDWQFFEAPTTSDPNVGTRFDGYQVGRQAIRLHYRALVGQRRIRVTEDVRAESRPEWQGFIREFRFTDLPEGSRVALSLPIGEDVQCYNAAGDKIASTRDPRLAPLLGYRSGGTHRVIRGDAGPGAAWLPFDEKVSSLGLSSAVATANEPVALRVDAWAYCGRRAEPTATERASLVKNAPQLDDSFDLPPQPLTPLPVVEAQTKASAPSAPRRAPVEPKENIDEFPSTRGRFLRFVVTATTGNAEPGVDELEVYGPGSDKNLALQGKATASSVIAGYPIHQIPHLNDGKLGNNHSWISAEKSGGWAQIEFPDPVEMNKIVWARDRTGVCRDRLATAYRIEISSDGKNWSTVGSEAGRSDAVIGAIRRDASPGYVMEAIPAPFPTWRPADVAFDGGETMYAIAMTEGQIWRTRVPPPGQPERVSWKRFATGLYHPTGIAIVDGRVFVAQKPEITELIDRNGDGICDEYRTVATGWGLSTGWHEYCFGLAVDPQKNLWFALNTGYFWTNPGFVNPGRWRGSILRVSHETERLDVMATGCRVPNGISQGPDGQIFFTDNQGDWIQSCKLAHVVPGRFYGHPETKEDALPKDQFPDGRSAVWMPYALSRSTSGPAHDRTQGKFGPFANQLFVGDVGYGSNPGIMRIALEKVDGEYQGACFRFVDGQPLGCERLKFGPDGQLYMASLSTGLTRMAFDGHTPMAIQSVHLRPNGQGFVVKLTKPLSANAQITPVQFRVKRYHYLYTGNYGSPQADEQSLTVTASILSPDRTEITLAVPIETHPLGMVYEINLGKLTDSEGEALMHNEAWYTVHRIPR